MRLGDYDALNALINKCVGIDGLGLEPVMAIRDIKALISVMPTIDAIPVEWLEEHDSEGNEYGRRYITVVEALSMWQKEQEAQDESTSSRLQTAR